ncbi:MAG: type I DNA topoisomerase [Acidimicrobiia bacterium]
MPKPLVIVESPSKARTIAGFLGRDYVVDSSVGHIRDLPRNAEDIPDAYRGTSAGRLGIDIDAHFQPIYVVPAEKKKVVAQLKKLLKDASELYLATDEDREGEAIAWHVLEVLNPKVPVKRMVFHEITKRAIEEAIQNWRELDMKLVEAQEGRRVLDRLVGYEISPVLWRKVMPKLSAGRVQSVATRLIVDRERARMRFHSAMYWGIDGAFSTDGASVHASLSSVNGTRLASGKDFNDDTGALTADAVALDETAARALAAGLASATFQVAEVETGDWKQSPYPPFITSTLQQEAGRKLRFGSAKAMAVAQRLYEGGYITYMRTDSTNLSDQAIAAARTQIRELYGDAYLPAEPRAYKRKVKNAQEAHEAIRPAGDRMRTPDSLRSELDPESYKLYELIWMRTVACQMADARGKRVSARIDARAQGGEQARFTATGRTIEFPGYLRAYVEGADDPDAELEDRESILPPLSVGDQLACQSLTPNGHHTQPPSRFTEASLVKELEARGIGRPSTYASVIQTIQDRGYVWKKGNALVPSWTAFATIGLLEEYFPSLVDYEFTARMEEDLDVIARGEAESEKWLHGFYFGNGAPGLAQLINEDRLAEIDARSVNTVPIGVDTAGHEVVVRVGRYGPYLQRGEDRASLPPDIVPDELTIPVALEILERQGDDGRELGSDPESGLSVIVRAGRFGPYVQLGEMPDSADKKAAKPKTASLFKTMTIERITLEEALELLALPRVVGVDTDGEAITAQNGRFGPYIKKGTDSRSLGTEEEIFSITLEAAQVLLAQPKPRGRQAKPPLADLGAHPETNAPVRVLEGRFGPYVTDGTVNASVPRGTDPEALTMDEAVSLLRARAEKIASGEVGGRAKPKKSTKKTAKKSAKKSATTTTKKAGKKAVKKSGGTTTRGRAVPPSRSDELYEDGEPA